VRPVLAVSLVQRLAGLVAVVVLGVIALVVTAQLGQREVAEHTDRVRSLTEASALLNHLDTREAELKVDGYRAVIGVDVADIQKDLPDDIDSVTETVAALEKMELPDDLRQGLNQVKPDVAAFNELISDVVRTAAVSQSSALASPDRSRDSGVIGA
jgi:methyl-accepting chemotaxis protein